MRLVTDESGLQPLHSGVLVPTMGALHAGHLALIRRARESASDRPVIVSIFVNPTQFNDPADFDRYPRTLEADLPACESVGANAVFVPSVEVMYPPGVTIETPPLPEAATEPRLEDAHRPGHFAGVCQVVKRLFDLLRPSQAVFGEKDWQQLAVIRAMVELLSLPIGIIPHATIREEDGLAMSSRNALLAPNHRRQATALWRALRAAAEHGDPVEAERAERAVLLANRIIPEYFAVRDSATLMEPHPGRPARALVAARVGGVRLIDNAPWPASG